MTTETRQTLAIGSWSHGTLRTQDLAHTILDMAEWPEDLRMREFPR